MLGVDTVASLNKHIISGDINSLNSCSGSVTGAEDC